MSSKEPKVGALGEGRKDRYAMLSPVLLDILRRWWREGYAGGLLLDGGWLFPGQNPVNSLSTRQLSRAIRAAAASAEIDKRVSMHLLRHSFATHLLEQKVDIRLIQVLLGHSQLETTTLYAQVATDLLQAVTSPLRCCRYRHDLTHVCFHPGGRGYLPRPRTELASGSCGSYQSCSAQGDVGD